MYPAFGRIKDREVGTCSVVIEYIKVSHLIIAIRLLKKIIQLSLMRKIDTLYLEK